MPLNTVLPWLPSTMTVYDPTSSSMEHVYCPENMTLLLAAVENLIDAIQNAGVRDEDELKKIKVVILIQVLDLIRQYFNTCSPKTSDTTEQCVTTTHTQGCVTSSIPYDNTSKPYSITTTPSEYCHRRRWLLSNDLPAYGAEVQPGLVDLINGYQD